ncbi:MAG TPA: GlsB/YeaQ/YmgE family stress response membrane protein [Chloroflexota bacterium]|nr:GlsB/YeaQ/YmgE family stress response membrane protein [Chloroflexota bacterium]
MPLVLLAVLVILAIAVFFWMVGAVVQLLLMLFVAGLVGWLADWIITQVMPGRHAYGWLGAIAAGLVGSWLGVGLFAMLGWHRIGPVLFSIPLLPALVGAIVLAVIVDLAGKALVRQRAL